MREQPENQTSSIGAVWPPIVSSNNRIKGFYEELVDTPQDTESFIQEFNRHQAAAESHPEVDRLSIRTLASVGSIAMFDSAGISLEGAMPIRGNKDLAIVYAAWNGVERTINEEQLAGHHDVLTQAVATPLKPAHALTDFRPAIIDRHTTDAEKSNMIEKFVDLYGTFGYDESDVEDILLNPANTIAFIEDEEGVVSTAMAERIVLPIEGHGDIRIAEVTEAITRHEMRGKGFYRAISRYLVDQLLDDDEQPLDVLYGESNLAVNGVLVAAHQNGRRFSYFDRERFGVRQAGFGVIQQSFKVEDNSEQRPYNDFALSYFPLS